MHESSSPNADQEAAFLPASSRVRPSRLVGRTAALSLLWFVVAGGTPSS